MSQVESNVESWGMIGNEHSWDGARRVLTRNVSARVRYQPPPLPAGLPLWRSTRHEQKFELPLSGDPRQAQSLESLCRQLNGRRRELRGAGWKMEQEPETVCFKAALENILEIARHLHANHCGLGLTTPQSILFLPTPEGEQLVLPDLGFFWKEGGKQGPFLPRRPDFLSKAESFGFLWDADGEAAGDAAVRQQFRGLARIEDFDSRQDVRSLARLFATCLLGKPCRRPPPPKCSARSNGSASSRKRRTNLAAGNKADDSRTAP